MSITLFIGSSNWLALQQEQAKEHAQEWVQLRHAERQPGQIYQELRSYSFFGNTRDVWVDDVDSLSKEEFTELQEGLTKISPTCRLWLTATSDNKLADLVNLVKAQNGRLVHQQQLNETQTINTIVKDLGLHLNPEHLAILQEAFANEPLRLKRELEKIALLPTMPIGSQLDAWRQISQQAAIVDGWRFANAVLAKDITKADAILDDWEQLGGNQASAGRDLLGSLAYVLRQHLTYKLLLTKGQPPQQAARQTPGRFGSKEQQLSNHWRIAELAAALSDLLVLDRQLKSLRLPIRLQLFAWCLKRI